MFAPTLELLPRSAMHDAPAPLMNTPCVLFARNIDERSVRWLALAPGPSQSKPCVPELVVVALSSDASPVMSAVALPVTCTPVAALSETSTVGVDAGEVIGVPLMVSTDVPP